MASSITIHQQSSQFITLFISFITLLMVADFLLMSSASPTHPQQHRRRHPRHPHHPHQQHQQQKQFDHECGPNEMLTVVQNHANGRRNHPRKRRNSASQSAVQFTCSKSTCLSQQDEDATTCSWRNTPCNQAANEWLSGWRLLRQSAAGDINSGAAEYKCCRSQALTRSSVERKAVVRPGQMALLRGFSESFPTVHRFYQFGEALSNVEIDQGTMLLTVSRFKCSSKPSPSSSSSSTSMPDEITSLPHQRRAKRGLDNGGFREPFDKPACDSEWSSETIRGLISAREGRQSSAGSRVSGGHSRITDVSFCGVEVVDIDDDGGDYYYYDDDDDDYYEDDDKILF